MYINGSANIEGNVSGNTFNFKVSPTTNNSSINLLVRNSTTGNIEQRTVGLQLSSPTLSNWTAFSGSTGIVAQTAAATWVGRTITASSGLTITNGNGVAGNPTISLAASAVTNINLWSAGTGTRSIIGGTNLTATAQDTLAVGRGNNAQAAGSFAGGYPATGSVNTVANGISAFSFQEASAQFFGVAAGVYDYCSAILGGRENLILGGGLGRNGIFAGNTNRISGGTINSVIIGGGFNNNYGSNSAILSSSASTLFAKNSAIIGGIANTISNSSTQSVIAGGNNNTINNASSFATGEYNVITGGSTSFAIGRSNKAVGLGAFVGGYPDNSSTVTTNIASGKTAFSFQEAYNNIYNIPSGVYIDKSTILGGEENIILGGNGYNRVCGIFSGYYNRISGATYATAIGGVQNSIFETGGVIIGGIYNTINHGGSVIIGGSGITTTDNSTVYVPNFKTTGFNQKTYVSVGAASITLNKETAVVIGTTTIRNGSVTITLPASPVNGQIISFRRTDTLANTFTIAPNTGYTLNVNGITGNYNMGVSTKIRLILIGTTWFDI